MNSVYEINKGINKSIEFKGLRAQYIWYLGAGIMLLLFVFGILYVSGLNIYLCVVLILITGTGMVLKIYALSAKYGEYGLLKKMAKRGIPKVIKCNSRRVFCEMNTKK